MINRILLTTSLLFAIIYSYGQIIATTNSEYHYFRGIKQPPEDCKNVDFDDSDWSIGYKTIGWGDGDDSTLIDTCSSVYLRIDFDGDYLWVSDELSLLPDFDDGFAAYINGQLIAKANLVCSQDSPPTYTQLAERSHEATDYRNIEVANCSYFISNEFINKYITSGKNVLAIEIHNDSIKGSDLSFKCDFRKPIFHVTENNEEGRAISCT